MLKTQLKKLNNMEKADMCREEILLQLLKARKHR